MPWLHSPMLQGCWTSTYGSSGNAGVRGNTAGTFCCSPTEVLSINWEPANTAAIASSAGKSTFGCGRSMPYGRSARPRSRVTETTFELHHRTVHLRSDHLLQTSRSHADGNRENPTLSHQSMVWFLSTSSCGGELCIPRKAQHALPTAHRPDSPRIAPTRRELPLRRRGKWRHVMVVTDRANRHARFRSVRFVFQVL